MEASPCLIWSGQEDKAFLLVFACCVWAYSSLDAPFIAARGTNYFFKHVFTLLLLFIAPL